MADVDPTNPRELPSSSHREIKLSGLQSALHGTSYQLKLGIVVCMANAKKSMNPANNFSFRVTAEDPAAGKFDDIVYIFQDSDKKGTLKIQAKHKLEKSEKLTLGAFTTLKETNNPLAIRKYFISFCDQQQPTTAMDMEGLIICTNTDISDDARKLWRPVEKDGSAPSLDSYIATLFNSIDGKCYRLDYEKLLDGTFSNLHQSLMQCSKRTRLAKLLVNAIKSEKDKITTNSIMKEYHPSILHIIDTKDNSTKDAYPFTKEFLESSCHDPMPGYEAFRKEFENQYRQQFQIGGNVWEDLKQKRVNVTKTFLTDSNDAVSSQLSFPDDNVNESLTSFCKKMRLVCDTKNENKLDEAIVDLWIDLYSDDDRSNLTRKGCVEGNVASEILFKTNYDWLMNPFAKPYDSDNIKTLFVKIKNKLGFIKLKGASDELRQEICSSPFRINQNVLKSSDLYKKIETESLLEVSSSDIQFGVSVLLDILIAQSKDLASTLFLHDSKFISDADTIEELLRCIGHPMHLIIICDEAFKMTQFIIEKWGNSIQNNSLKQAILVRKSSKTTTDFSFLLMRDVAEESLKQFLRETINLCTTTVAPTQIFQDNIKDLSIEDVIKLLDIGNQMHTDNEIVKQYQLIKNSYVPRWWITETEGLSTTIENCTPDRDQMMGILKNMRELHGEQPISIMEITERVHQTSIFDSIFQQSSNSQKDPIINDNVGKVLILLGEAGSGKSTNLTWLAWHLRNQNPSSWTVRCNLSDYCTAFKRYTPIPQDGLHIEENEAIRLLYEMIHLTFAKLNGDALQAERRKAQKCSECLFLSHGKVVLNGDLMAHHGLTSINSIQLVMFREKFNTGELVLLFDGFDEIAPDYKEVSLEFLRFFAKFDGLSKLYLTSRPHDFKEQFDASLEDSLFYQLKPLSLQEKGSLVYKILLMKIHGQLIEDNNETYKQGFFKALCVIVLHYLDQLSDVPLHLMTSVEIFVSLADQYINFPSKTIRPKFFDKIERKFKPSFIVDEFVTIKIRSNVYTKIGADFNTADNPIEIKRFRETIEDAKYKHGLVALWYLSKNNRNQCLTIDEIREATKYLKEIVEARVKTGIINGIRHGKPIFIHRSFAEYLAAWRIVHKSLKDGKDSRYWYWVTKLKHHVDMILAKHYPLHLSIIERDFVKIKSLLAANPEALYEKDVGDRCPLHLLMSYASYDEWYNISPIHLRPTYIFDAREKILGLTPFEFMLIEYGKNLNEMYQRENRWILILNDFIHNVPYVVDHYHTFVNASTLFKMLIHWMRLIPAVAVVALLFLLCLIILFIIVYYSLSYFFATVMNY